ncbi:MAG: 50S ribosomal protein L4 [Patescibacteria group bacterium]
MAKVKVYNLEGKDVGELTLSSKIFDVAASPTVVHEASVAQMHNARQPLAHTKTRADVRGGGRKPWKQKGTGRARHGSTRSPIWVGGGVTFGPRSERTFDVKINKKMRRKAICMLLSDRVRENHFIAVENLGIEGGKTAKLVKALKALPIDARRSVLIVIDPKNMEARRAAQNLQKVRTIAPNSLNVNDLLRSGYVMAGKSEIELMTSTFER